MAAAADGPNLQKKVFLILPATLAGAPFAYRADFEKAVCTFWWKLSPQKRHRRAGRKESEKKIASGTFKVCRPVIEAFANGRRATVILRRRVTSAAEEREESEDSAVCRKRKGKRGRERRADRRISVIEITISKDLADAQASAFGRRGERQSRWWKILKTENRPKCCAIP
ncbi:uncharacterized protein LOC143216482 [Lasioglossum baleicum]|uniref:uncharacterized protein LOC143216482 n=1 Tax=Lasioglossum baleicum TaxID=434251 RepID=UPI003FCD8570